MSVTFINSDRLIRELEKAPEEVDQALRQILNDAGEEIVSKAKQKAPVRTGALRESIKKKLSPAKSKPSVKVFADYPKGARRRKGKTKKQAAGSKGYYAFAVEHGTKTQAPQPYLVPSAREVEEQLPGRVEAVLNKAIDKAVGK